MTIAYPKLAKKVLSQDKAKEILLDATMKKGPDQIDLFWDTFYHSEFVKASVAYDPEWAEGSYMNGAVDAEIPEIEIGEIARSVFPGENKRRILIIKTRFGNLVLFERYTPTAEGRLSGPIVCNQPRLVRLSEMFRCTSALTIQDLVDALGDGWCHDNLGLRLEAFFGSVKRNEGKGIIVD